MGIIWIACIIVAYIVGEKKQRPWLGFLFGFFLGPLGLLLIYIWPSREAWESMNGKLP